MQEEMQSEDEISLSAIFQALWSKIWILVAGLLAGVMIGGAFAFVKYHDVHYYGANVEYFITSNPKDSEGSSGQIYTSSYGESVFITIVSLLSSEAFNQELMKDLPETQNVVFPQSENFTKENAKEYDKYLKLLTDSLSYSYDYKAGNLKAKVSVLNDASFAVSLLKQAEANIPEFIESRMTNDEAFRGKVTCEQMSYQRSGLMNAGQTTKEMVKFGLIVGLVALIVACVAVVIADRTDTRLRNYEEIPRKFHLPVLGVIPRIETLAEEDQQNKKKTEAIK